MFTVQYLVLMLAMCQLVLSAGPTTDRASQEEYLKRFSHLGSYNPDPRMAAMQDNPDAQFKIAVRSFQRFAGLRVTGTVDGRTLEMMQMPRCGVPDLQNNMGGIERRRRRRRYTTTGDKWKQPGLTYRFRSYTSDMSPATTKQDFVKAFQLWSDVSPLQFSETSSLSDIEISFGVGNHGDDAPFDGPGGTLAHAYFPGLGIGGDAHFDDAESYTSGTYQGTNLLQVATHELGHSLGLGHSENQEAIMAPFYRSYKPNLKLESDDIEGITYLYGRKPTTRAVPRAGSSTTPKPTRGIPEPENSPTAFCHNPVIDAIDIVNGSIHVFYGDKYLQLDDNGQIRPGFPKKISSTFNGLPNNIDAVLSLENPSGGSVYFFKDRYVYEYDRRKPTARLQGVLISTRFASDLTTVDAAFVWTGNGQIYFIKGVNTYRYFVSNGVGYVYNPRPLSEWKDLPTSISDAFRHTGLGKTFFFSEKKTYIFNDREFKVQSVEDTYEWMRCCNQELASLRRAAMLSHSGLLARMSVPWIVMTAAIALKFSLP